MSAKQTPGGTAGGWQADGPDATIAAVSELIHRTAAAHPRSLQREIGPSEAGEPCARQLAYKMMNWPQVRADLDPWAAVQGVAVHGWLADAFRAENERLGRDRYLIEHRVEPCTQATTPVPGTLTGSCDLFDRDTGTVTDWKLSSPDRIRHYAANGPGPKYHAQAHLYGLGLANAGETVRTVSIAFLPRAARLDGLHIWSEPYDPAIAAAALERLAGIRDLLLALDVEAYPGRWALFPAATESCRHCPWLKPGSRYLAAGCPGRLDDAPSSAESLIA